MNLKKLWAHQITTKIVLISFYLLFYIFFLMPRIVVPQGRVEVSLLFVFLPIATMHCQKASHFTVAHYPVS